MSSIGERLKNARIKKQLSIDDVVNKINIRSFFLKAMENDRFDELPEGDAYRKAFLKNYADIVELDKEEIINLYCHLQAQKELLEKSREIEKPDQQRLGSDWPSYAKGGLILLSILIISVIFYYFKVSSNQSAPLTVVTEQNADELKGINNPKEEEGSEKKLSEQETLGVINDSKETEPSSPDKALEKLLVLKARAIRDVEFELQIDQEIPLTITLKRDDIKEWPAQEKITLSMTDAGGVEWTLNDNPPQILGQDGKSLKNIVLTRSKKKS